MRAWPLTGQMAFWAPFDHKFRLLDAFEFSPRAFECSPRRSREPELHLGWPTRGAMGTSYPPQLVEIGSRKALSRTRRLQNRTCRPQNVPNSRLQTTCHPKTALKGIKWPRQTPKVTSKAPLSAVPPSFDRLGGKIRLTEASRGALRGCWGASRGICGLPGP
jgi:hypothetical protein